MAKFTKKTDSVPSTSVPRYKVIHPIVWEKKTYMQGEIVELPEKNAKYAGSSVVLIPDSLNIATELPADELQEDE